MGDRAKHGIVIPEGIFEGHHVNQDTFFFFYRELLIIQHQQNLKHLTVAICHHR